MTIGVSWEYSRNKNYVGILGECSENSTRIQWEYYGNGIGNTHFRILRLDMFVDISTLKY